MTKCLSCGHLHNEVQLNCPKCGSFYTEIITDSDSEKVESESSGTFTNVKHQLPSTIVHGVSND
ncbi:MAG: hypothetical protein PHQ03_09420 [Methylococcales bacterium]|nr:hypothetical protein [Methylococcales bacterium]